jgi:mannitol/fructose-specific phosphotransferase system IIA component (Ntr-type)
LTTKTQASVLRQMAARTEQAGRVSDPRALLDGVEAQEMLCSTGIPGGLAFLHSRSQESYLRGQKGPAKPPKAISKPPKAISKPP